MTPILMTAGGFALLWIGGELLVRGGVGLARRFGVSSFTIGLTIVAFGTSAPELVVSIMAAMADKADVAVANVVGSNIANIALILGLAIILHPVRIHRQRHGSEMGLLVLHTLIVVVLLYDRCVSRIDGAVILLVFCLFLWRCFKLRAVGLELDAEAESECICKNAGRCTGDVVGGLVLLALGGRLAVDGAVELAHQLGLSDWFIGVTVVALGTSLPELAASIVAARRGQGDMAFGNVVGSNIFNTLLITGVASMVRPLSVSEGVGIDLAVMTLLTLLIWYWCRIQDELLRLRGILLVLLYLAYVGIKLI